MLQGLVSEHAEIPARSEKIIKGKILANHFRNKDICLIEPIESMFYSGGSIVAKSLVRRKQEVPMRIINPTNDTQILYPGTRIATASQVCEVQKTKIQTQHPTKHNEVPSH